MKINRKAAQIYNDNKRNILRGWYNGATYAALAEKYGIPADYLTDVLAIQEHKDIRKDFADGIAIEELADMYNKTQEDIAKILGIKIK